MTLFRTLTTAILLSGIWAMSVHAQLLTRPQPLFPGDSLVTWSLRNAEADSFVLEDGVLTVTGDQGWLRSPQRHDDFILRGQFRFLSENADSGIFIRAGTGTPFIRGWPGDSYQVQIRDISINRSNSPLPLAQLYRHRVPGGTTHYDRARVFRLYRGVGQWHDIRIEAIGDTVTVFLNDEQVMVGDSLDNANGYLGFQSEAGTVQYRNMTIHEL